jgi:enterochelin esterase-like enzyme
MHRIVEEIMPLMREHFAISSDPSKNAFGGGSFAGVTALYAAMRFPHVCLVSVALCAVGATVVSFPADHGFNS